MIKVTIGESKTQEKPFPKLMEHRDGTITRFVEPSIGVHIYANHPIVDSMTLWVETEGICMDRYYDYNEPITIQNQ